MIMLQPHDALHGDWNDAILTLTSQSDPRVSKAVILTSTAFWHRMLMPVSLKN